MSVVARRLTIRGRVQGVGFRDATCRYAHGAGATGWVRNRRDGSVEVLVQGSREIVEVVADWARQGPPSANVVSIDVVDAPIDAALTAFDVRPTV